jgi:hypothetical protein
MAINDRPKIDPTAFNSARSERRLNDWLNEDYQFILRKEIPDKGCDYMCELLEDSGATNLKFPVQLKSIEHPEFVGNGDYISYPVLTSRLGYMLNLLPTTGIFVLYDVSTEKLYYDFSYKIFQRINADRGSDEWTIQEYVNIRIPVSNLFSKDVITALHSETKKMFNNAERMQQANGERYELPVIEMDGSTNFDWNNKNHLNKALKKFGLALLTRYDLAPVYNSLVKFTQLEIENDKGLLFLACFAYGETGHFYQADIFINKLKRNYHLDDDEKTMIEYADCKNLSQLGRITNKEFIQRLESLRPRVTDLINQITVRINLQRLQIMETKELKETPPEIVAELGSIFETIDSSSLEQDSKDILTIWNAEQESHLLTHKLHMDFLSYTLSLTVKREMPMEERRQMIVGFMDKERKFLNRVNTIYRRAFDKSNKLIMASGLGLLAQHFIFKLFAFISQGAPLPAPEEEHKKFFGYAYRAFQLYAEISQLKGAHYCLCNAIEIMYSARFYNAADVDDDMKNLMAEKDRIEKYLMLEPNIFQMPILIEKVNRTNDWETDKSLAGLSDNQVEQLAKTMFKSFRIPEERFIHLHNELLATRMFQERCHDSDIILLTSSGLYPDDPYRAPVSYILKNKKTGLESVRSYNINELLLSWRM